METLVIGEGLLTLHEVAKVIEKSTSFASLQTRWRVFARHIGISEAELPGLELGISSRTLQLKEVPREVLKIWKAEKGTKATLEVLCSALDECFLRDIADALKANFCPVQLEKQFEFIFQENVYTLEKLFGNNVPKQVSQMIRSYWEAHSTTEPMRILRREVCPLDLPVYYIPRTLSDQNKLDEKIFRADTTKKHIFLVKGARKPELARASGSKPIERSGNQLDEVTVQHILLEHDDDFDRICGTTSKPVHMIEFKDNSFHHLKSRARMEEVQAFIMESGVAFGEAEAVKTIQERQSPLALSIADSPGMGKTFLLAKLSALIKENNPKAVALFIVLQEIVQSLHDIDSTSSIIEAISSYSTSNKLTDIIFQEMLKSNNYQLFLFLDGYDEVTQDKLDLVDLFIHRLIDFQNIKIIVTTRPHLKPRLENILQRLSFRILPFSHSNQTEFLTKYWSSKHGAKEGEMLKAFAQKCLQSLEMNMSDKEKYIAGIPLQCYMLAEVYAQQARRASKLESLPEDVVKITSFFEMYKSLVDLKFNRIGNSVELRQKYFDAHVHDAIALLLTYYWQDRFKSLLSPREEVEETLMYSIGLIEKSPSSNAPRFLHRTFAENLLAQFTVNNLDKNGTCLEFLFTEIFGKNGTARIDRLFHFKGTPPGRPALYELKHPAIAFFVEMHLRDRVFSNKFNKFEFLNALDLTNISDEDVCTAINVSCCCDLENCFDLFRKLLEKFTIKDELSDKYFKQLPHLVVERTDNVSLLQKVLNFTNQEFGVNLDWHVFERYFFNFTRFYLDDCTPLHVAVYHGKYNMVIHLLEEYGQDVLSMSHLIYCCLLGSSTDKDSVIEDKLSIIETLTNITRKWLEEECNLQKPILQKDAHVTLIKYLVEVGADINTYDERFGTILHCQGDKNTYAELVGWALNNGFNLINHVDRDRRTPLMLAIERFQILDDDVLRLFDKAGADFNARDKFGDSVLFYAIFYSRSVKFVEKILGFGASHTHRNYSGENAAHFVIDNNRDDSVRAIELLQLLLSRGFKGLHQNDKRDCTPIREAIKYGIVNDEIIKYFVEAGADEDGDSVLFYALQYTADVELIKKLLNFGENVNHRNREGENAAHIVIMYHYRNPQLALNILKLLELHGFRRINEIDSNRTTPLGLAERLRVENKELLKYLKERDSFCLIL